MVLKETVTISELKDRMTDNDELIKFCIDKKRHIIAIAEEMHIEMEHELYDDGSDYSDIYGGNIMLDKDNPYIIWEGHPNIERNKVLGGKGRLLKDQATIDELSDILFKWVK